MNTLELVPQLFWDFNIHKIEDNLVAETLSNDLLGYIYGYLFFYYFFCLDTIV